MAREFSKSFYRSKEWIQTREYILKRDNYLCKKCGAPAEEVHHIIHLTPNNIGDTKVNMNPDNLVSLCKSCHFEEHYTDKARGHMKEQDILPEYVFDSNGQIVPTGI